MRLCLRLAVFPHPPHWSDVVSPQAWRLTGVGKTLYTTFIRKCNFWGSMCLRLPHVTALSFALSHLVHVPYFLCLTTVAIHLTSSRRWISSKIIFLLFIVDSLDHQHCGWRPRPALPFATVPIISFILRDNSALSTAIFAFHFWPVIKEGWVFFMCVYI